MRSLKSKYCWVQLTLWSRSNNKRFQNFDVMMLSHSVWGIRSFFKKIEGTTIGGVGESRISPSDVSLTEIWMSSMRPASLAKWGLHLFWEKPIASGLKYLTREVYRDFQSVQYSIIIEYYWFDFNHFDIVNLNYFILNDIFFTEDLS